MEKNKNKERNLSLFIHRFYTSVSVKINPVGKVQMNEGKPIFFHLIEEATTVQSSEVLRSLCNSIHFRQKLKPKNPHSHPCSGQFIILFLKD